MALSAPELEETTVIVELHRESLGRGAAVREISSWFDSFPIV